MRHRSSLRVEFWPVNVWVLPWGAVLRSVSPDDPAATWIVWWYTKLRVQLCSSRAILQWVVLAVSCRLLRVQPSQLHGRDLCLLQFVILQQDESGNFCLSTGISLLQDFVGSLSITQCTDADDLGPAPPASCDQELNELPWKDPSTTFFFPNARFGKEKVKGWCGLSTEMWSVLVNAIIFFTVYHVLRGEILNCLVKSGPAKAWPAGAAAAPLSIQVISAVVAILLDKNGGHVNIN